MKRTWIVLFLTCALALTAAGCSAGGDAKRVFLSVGTAPAGGAFFVVGGALAEVLTDNAGDNGWQVSAEATKGSKENIRRLTAGELDLALANSAITYFAVRGEGEDWQTPAPVRAMMTLAPNVALFLAPRGGAVTSIADLAGERVYVGPAGAGFDYFLRPILAAHGVDYDDLQALNGTQAQGGDMLADGSAAAVFLGGAVPTASITQAAASQDLLYLPYSEEAMEALTRHYLFFDRATVPAGKYRGLDEDFHGLDVGSMHLIASADAADEKVYRITKTLYEARDQVVAKHGAGRAINEKNVVRDTGTPFHPGAIRYYREIGIWPDGRD